MPGDGTRSPEGAAGSGGWRPPGEWHRDLLARRAGAGAGSSSAGSASDSAAVALAGQHELACARREARAHQATAEATTQLLQQMLDGYMDVVRTAVVSATNPAQTTELRLVRCGPPTGLVSGRPATRAQQRALPADEETTRAAPPCYPPPVSQHGENTWASQVAEQRVDIVDITQVDL